MTIQPTYEGAFTYPFKVQNALRETEPRHHSHEGPMQQRSPPATASAMPTTTAATPTTTVATPTTTAATPTTAHYRR